VAIASTTPLPMALATSARHRRMRHVEAAAARSEREARIVLVQVAELTITSNERLQQLGQLRGAVPASGGRNLHEEGR
jgi:hypothetical protein